MVEMKKFDLLKTPLEGASLIEASAGTGKTYAITGLFLRLILEKNFAVDRILVVTYTEAATAELKERIRSRLLATRDAFLTGTSNDEFINSLVQKNKDINDALNRINDAIRCFDQASIFTIHGFCMRTLYENAFESGSLFDTDLIENQDELETETADDFWRKRFYKAPGFIINYLIEKKIYPDTLLSSIGNSRSHPDLKIIPDQEITDAGLAENRYRDTFNAVAIEWRSSKKEITNILLNNSSLNRNRYRIKAIEKHIVEMDAIMSSSATGSPLFKGFEKFTTSVIADSIKKDCVAPEHNLFDLCEALKTSSEALESVYDNILVGFKKDLIDFIKGEMTRRKQAENVRSFNDLLTDVHEALLGEKGNLLSEAIRRAYGAALIDEFQDTDPIQYAIFHKVFGKGNSILFLIGDPKQAIYGFRGADIFTYMQAAKMVQKRYTLKENYRSESSFITAVNTVFNNASNPFLFEDIMFEMVSPPTIEINSEELSISGEDKKPFIVWQVNSENNNYGKREVRRQSISRGGDRVIADAVAGEISRLLYLSDKGNVFIGDRSFTSGDAAVLVRTNAEAEIVKESLNQLNIPGVVYGSGNVLESGEAKELERVLAGIIRADKDAVLKAALATEMIGVSDKDLFHDTEKYEAIEEHREIFLDCRDLWQMQGFMKMFRKLLRLEKIMTRLIAFTDGERRITNILHLAEILQKKSVEAKIDAEDLLRWFQRQLDPMQIRLREEQLRLESDENAVKIITIHKSKGLEFPVVFCPFLWGKSSLRKNSPVLFHDMNDQMKLTLDVGSKQLDTSRFLAERELLAENLRLVYVALTRAKNRCYMVWGKLNKAETSAPAYLFHQPKPNEGDMAQRVKDRYLSFDENALSKDLFRLSANSAGSISITELPRENGEPYKPIRHKTEKLLAREFNGRIERSWRISSFSSIAHRRHGDDAADHDGLFSGKDPGVIDDEKWNSQDHKEIDPVFLFPKGAKAGTCLHEILENIEFTEPASMNTVQVVEQKLNEYGFKAEWKDTVCGMIENVLSAPLDKNNRDLKLMCISGKDRLNELGFYYPLNTMAPKKLKKVFLENGSKTVFSNRFFHQVDMLDSSVVSGYMKGFVDLIFHYKGKFYIVDWKSNFLGYSRNDYSVSALSKEMEHRLYILQYHIYAVALHKYLKIRMPEYRYEKNFGGIYYIFLRGISGKGDDDFGIYHDRPDETLINRLCDLFENQKS